MLTAAEAMARTAVDLLLDLDVTRQTREDFAR